MTHLTTLYCYREGSPIWICGIVAIDLVDYKYFLYEKRLI